MRAIGACLVSVGALWLAAAALGSGADRITIGVSSDPTVGATYNITLGGASHKPARAWLFIEYTRCAKSFAAERKHAPPQSSVHYRGQRVVRQDLGLAIELGSRRPRLRLPGREGLREASRPGAGLVHDSLQDPPVNSGLRASAPCKYAGMILAIDQGTTGTTCLVFDEQAEPIGRAYREFAQHFPRPGWVEHDAAQIWEVTHAVAGEALADAGVTRPGELHAVGITNQRETVCVWDPDTGEPLHRAIVWQDRRTARRCDELREQGHERLVRDRTGLVLDPYFSATKIEWLLRTVDGLRDRARSGRAMFGTVDAWLIYKLTGERATDASNAARTMLFDIAAGGWDSELLDLFGVPERRAPARSSPVAGRSRLPAPTRSTGTRFRSRASRAISRRRCSARRASTRDSARTPTALARSSCRTRATSRRRLPMDCSARSPGGSATG